jgi:subtilase family serine protease
MATSTRPGVGLRAILGSVALMMASAVPATGPSAGPALYPALAEHRFVSPGVAVPDEAACQAVGARCFGPAAIRAAYDLGPLYAAGSDGRGMTIAIVDAFGSDTISHDLHVYDEAFGLQPMCGEEDVVCSPGMPTFDRLHVQGAPATVAQPGNGTHLQDRSSWAIETSLDVELAHAIAPRANILLVTSPAAESTLLLNAEAYIVDRGLADVISQSFGGAEESFEGTAALLQQHQVFEAAAAVGISVLASSGDSGTSNYTMGPVAWGGRLIPHPSVQWPASDPLVTGVGGTYLCVDTATGTTVDSSSPSGKCPQFPGAREVAWTYSGGGYSQVFQTPSWQTALPADSSQIGAMRGVPDVSLVASAGTGPLVFASLPPIVSDIDQTGWYVVGGTSVSSPSWAGLVAIADQIDGGRLGLLDPGLYRLASDPGRYAADFHDVATGNTNQTDPSVGGYVAGAGWDPVTGLGTPDAARLLPDLVAAVNGH